MGGVNILSDDDTIEKILQNSYSMSRFGDGELSIILDNASIGFQKTNPILAEKLEKVLTSPKENLLICLPLPLNSVRGMKKKAKRFWTAWAMGGGNRKRKLVKKLSEACVIREVYGNTQVTRPYIDYVNREHATELFELLKRLWNKKDVLIVEGEYTRLGVGNDLFSNVNSIKRILAPSENAFDKYDDILSAILESADNRLVLLALGPTATILAWELCDYKIQALDVGHVDIEYEWFLRKSEDKEMLNNKYVNEANNFVCIHNADLSGGKDCWIDYEGQIIRKI